MSIIKKLSGDNSSEFFKGIYLEYFDRLFSYALIITKSEDLAKDVVSDVFFNLWKTRINLAAINQLKSYLYTCVKNQAIKTLSSDPVRFDTESYKKAVASVEWINPEELLIGKELQEILESIITDLPPQCGLVFGMIKERRMNQDEVATELGISKETVKYHLKVALKHIRKKLEDRFDDHKMIDWWTSGAVFLILSKVIFEIL